MTGDTDSTKSVEAGGDLLTQGFILITVLWLAGLLAVLAIAFTLTTRATLLAGRNILAGERAQYAADGMTLELARRIAQSSDTGSGSPQAGPFQCQWSQGIFISLDTQDQGGLVDINTASPPLLKKLLLGLEADVVRAQLVLDALTDYRDADSLAQSIGSEPETYAARKFGPKNAPLASLDELDQIPELSEDTYWKLRRLVTVHSQQPGIDFSVAPHKLLEILGTSPADQREGNPFASPSPRRTFEIRAAAQTPDGSRFVRRAMIFLLRQPERPFAILSWEQDDWPDGLTMPSRNLLPCFN